MVKQNSDGNGNYPQQAIAGLNIDFLAVRSRAELIDVISKKFSKLIEFDDVVISLADYSNGTHRNFIRYSVFHVDQNEMFFKLTDADYPLDDGFYDVTLSSDKPLVWDLTKLSGSKNVPLYLQNIARDGMKKILGVALAEKKGNMGCLYFLSRNLSAFTGDESTIALTISHLLPAVLNNIMYNEAAEQKNIDKELLFELLSDISSVQNRVDLNKLAAGKLGEGFQFNSFIIPVINQDYPGYEVSLSYFGKGYEISNAEADEINNTLFLDKDDIIGMVMRADYPQVWDLEEIMHWQQIPSYALIWYENNMKRIAGIPVRINGANVGAILFASGLTGSFQEEELLKINRLKHQLGTAVVNVLTNEERKNREYEKEALLALSNDIAAIRNKAQLLSIIRTKLKPLLHFNDLVITVLNPDKLEYSVFVYELEEKRLKHQDFKRQVNSLHPVDDGIINQVMQSDYPATFIVEDLLKNGHAPAYVNFYRDTGVKEIVGIAMRNGREDVGALFWASERVNSFSKGQMSLIRSISSQLSLVIANIIANELIAERESDVSFLLSFSNGISTVRDRKTLKNILQERIKDILAYEHLVIVLYDQENDVYYNLIKSDSHRRAEPVFGNERVVANGLGKALIGALQQVDGPVIYELKEMLRHDLLNTDMLEDEQKLVGVGIRNGEQILGGLFLQLSGEHQFSKKHYGLLQGIADQLSFTVVNILSSERALKKEYEQTLLLELSKDIAKVRDRKDLLRIVQDRLSDILKFSYAFIIKLNDERDSGQVFLEFTPSQTFNGSNATGRVNDENININGIFFNHVLTVGQATVFTPHELITSFGNKDFWNDELLSNAKQGVAIPFYDNKQATGFFIAFTGQEARLTKGLLDLLQDFCAQLSIALVNIVANDRIEQQISEISGFKQQLEVENLYLQEEIYTTHNYIELIGMSSSMHEVFRLISQVSETQSSVLLLGETGTGKELIARAIHNNSQRKNKVMVKVNCATLPSNLIESELFGHERGSFTGATDRRIGKFELANNSTIFLDEIGEMPLDLQAKLLRALQEKEIERVGGRSVIKTDVRVIAATNRDLTKEVQLGNFRSDLFFRLNIFPITIPPLRERIDDIPLLAVHFLEKHNKKSNKKVIGFSTSAMKELMSYSWPGNVRELEHLIERTILMASQPVINHLHLPVARAEVSGGNNFPGAFKTIDEVERDHIMAVLKSCRGKVGGLGGAAEILKLPVTTVHSKMKRLGIGKKFHTNG
ncbi:sigma-54-dependent Fis family transcriptional regulator [Mucilaginibacter aquaedulcis]|uniref:sigma-54-dependent Fis family transcriptional regulator n=1 Tax=Mucilaginibacter aquaedulcis TaxID=1187081 RepID=UPI0025B5273F|nr:sigma 54-interacting transcriptional regulator [Mucilaginibacter aquaedulcis]MDN3548886.1 sigma 54-interacting transcriptional regulator [Mucilaginibacter aquaedulcis]